MRKTRLVLVGLIALLMVGAGSAVALADWTQCAESEVCTGFDACPIWTNGGTFDGCDLTCYFNGDPVGTGECDPWFPV